MAASASLSDLPGGRLNEIVVATYWLWWFTASGVEPGAKRATAESGTMVSVAVATAAPVEALPWPVVAMADWAAVRTALLAAVLDDDAVEALPAIRTVALRARTVPLAERTVGLAVATVPRLAAESAVDDSDGLAFGVRAEGPIRVAGALTAPAPSWVEAEPLGCPPDVLTQIWFSIAAFCQ